MIVDITGNRYGLLTVKGFSHTENRRSYWICECECGNIVTLRKSYFAYKCSHQQSCGCLHRKKSSQRMYEYHKRKRKGKAINEQRETD